MQMDNHAQKSLMDQVFPVSRKLYEQVAFWLLAVTIWLPVIQSPVYLVYAIMRTPQVMYGFVAYVIGYVFYAAQMVCVLFSLWYLISRVRAVRMGAIAAPKSPWAFVKAHPLGALYSVFLLLGVVSTLGAEDVARSVFGDPQRIDGYLTYLGFGALIFTASLVRDGKKRMLLIRNFVVMLALCTGLMLLQQFEAPVIREIFTMKGAAFFRNTNHFAYLLAIAALAAAGFLYAGRSRRERVTGGVLMGFFLLALFYNDTLGSHVAVLAAFVLMAILYRPATGGRRVTALIPFIVYVGLMALTYLIPAGRFECTFVKDNIVQALRDLSFFKGSSEGAAAVETAQSVSQAVSRLTLWKHTLRFIAERPLFGCGPDQIDVLFARAGVTFSDSPHNEYLNLAAYFGIPAALCCYGGQIWLLVRRICGIRHIGRTTFIVLGAAFAYAVSAFFGVSQSHAASYYYIMLGLVAAGEAGADEGAGLER